ncbi:dTDP-4-dehydrorhamnose 3,5-epimerase [Lactiplantibacillus plantarum]|uniref:dTDP-4-dehydrorhamnose 3,5-epimerase n=1 Tax=Lactiplantibacillus plantarum TaxID=1590 RepID=UPI000D305065|nr:dTDP-4-dehydrorhamnose 3,5-epimerase [Lactiplantibacillus plantarum]PTM28864.1 dTDP-4-dehydrorhamnose 3,5-epimerase [Lactiplantibacillus plantarum]
MGKLRVITTKLQDVKIIEPAVFGDKRGFFTETYSDRDFEEAGIDFDFIQDNQSLSAEAGVLRGLHFQRGKAAQTKLIRVVTGAVLDVIVDVRAGSPTYGEWEGYIISESNHRQLLVPRGFAHGFVTLTDNVNFLYKCDNYYNAEADGGITFMDKDLNINWPIDYDQAMTSDKDAKQQTFKEFEQNNPFVYGEI